MLMPVYGFHVWFVLNFSHWITGSYRKELGISAKRIQIKSQNIYVLIWLNVGKLFARRLRIFHQFMNL